MKKRILLVGGNNKARSLAISLIKHGYQVSAINNVYEHCTKLAEIEGLNVIYGDGTKPYILDEAEASDCDMVIALTTKDEDNLVICELCKKKFNVPKVVSLVSDPKKTNFFYKMGIDNVVCAINAVTNIIEQQAFVEEMTNMVSIGKGRVQVVEVHIDKNDPSVGKKLWEITFPKESIIGCIMRGDITIIPRGDTRIMADDDVIVIASNGQEIDAIKELKGRK